MDRKASYSIEPVVACDPAQPLLRDVFLVVDADGRECARTFDPNSAALVCAAFIAMAQTSPPKRVRCPACLGTESSVWQTQATDAGIQRRRKCLACGANYKTIELVDELTTPGEPNV